MSKVYVIADLHLGHDNLAIHRGFASVEQHDEFIINQWNNGITKHDTVWILGDIAMNKRHYPLLDQLRGTKNIIMGNHDLPKDTTELLKHVRTVCGMWQKKGSILTHCPIHPSQFYRFKKNIHGHLHEDCIDDERYINVSCEQIEYTPVLLETLL